MNLHFENNDSCYLIKFGKKDYLEQIQKGLMRFTRLSYYRDFENETSDTMIRDEKEGVGINFNSGSNISIIFNHPRLKKSLDLSNIVSKVISFPSCKKYISCFSYFTALDVHNHTLFSERMLNEEYDSILFIIDSIGFVNEIKKATNNFILKHGKVSYYNPKYNLYNLTEFDKTVDYKYQKEYRFSIEAITKQNSKCQNDSESIIIPYQPVNSVIIPINEFKNCFEIIGDER